MYIHAYPNTPHIHPINTPYTPHIYTLYTPCIRLYKKTYLNRYQESPAVNPLWAIVLLVPISFCLCVLSYRRCRENRLVDHSAQKKAQTEMQLTKFKKNLGGQKVNNLLTPINSLVTPINSLKRPINHTSNTSNTSKTTYCKRGTRDPCGQKKRIGTYSHLRRMSVCRRFAPPAPVRRGNTRSIPPQST